MLRLAWVLGLLGANAFGGASTSVSTSASTSTSLRAEALPSYEEVRARDAASDLVFLAKDGERIGSIRTDDQVRRFSWVELDKIAPLAREVLVATEDQDFFDHQGVDWFALAGNAVKAAVGAPARGASTITMQLVSLIDEVTPRPRGKRGMQEKWNQVKAALELEHHWTKNQILEAYLNLVPLKGEVVGIHAAAKVFFGKDPGALDPVDAALLVAMLPSPNVKFKSIQDRACVFLKHVYRKTPERGEEFCRHTRARPRLVTRSERSALSVRDEFEVYLHTWLSRNRSRLMGEKDSIQGPMKTTLDFKLQTRVAEAARDVLSRLQDQNVSDLSALVLDNQSGEVLSWIGNVPGFSKSPEVDGVIARRQAGSTLKPFFYERAMRMKKVDVRTTFEDKPELIPTGNGSFRPENYDHEFHGTVSLPVALASSLNIPAIQVVQKIGVDEAVKVLQENGFQDLKPAYVYGPSIALGTVDATLEELVRGYRNLFLRTKDHEEARWIARILSDRSSRALTFGLNSVLNTPFFTAVKTGTSKDMRDNWCVGFSDRYTVGVWVGNFNGTPMHDVSGVSGAAPLWARIMAMLHDRSPSLPLKGLAKLELPELEPEKRAPSEWVQKILYPVNEAIFAYDPEIPDSRQKILFKPKKTKAQDRWFLNGEPVAGVETPYLWSVQRGRFRLEIRSREGAVLDAVSFVVR
jgi:penicillin-binding protein 1C